MLGYKYMILGIVSNIVFVWILITYALLHEVTSEYKVIHHNIATLYFATIVGVPIAFLFNIFPLYMCVAGCIALSVGIVVYYDFYRV